MLNDPNAPTDAQQRENAEPSESIRPIPKLVSAVTLALVLFGVGYILLSEPFGSAEFGDRRTLADLGPVAAAPGAVDGKALYAAHCVACHQANGKGLAGVFPPLDASEWVTGDPRVLVNILLHGIEGPIEVAGTRYDGQMPPFERLSDAELAALASSIRSQWSNQAAPIEVDTIARERAAKLRDAPFAGGDDLKSIAAPAH